MSTDIVVPQLGESVSEAIVAKWHKKPGDAVAADEPLVELETDKVTIEVNAPTAGVMGEIKQEEGATVEVGAILGALSNDNRAAAAAKAIETPAKTSAPAPTASAPSAPTNDEALAPSVRKLLDENGLKASQLKGTGKDGRILKGDVLDYLEKNKGGSAPKATTPPAPRDLGPREERVKISRLRQRIAVRLKEAQNNAAMLTTFNEIDMGNVMELRKLYREGFEKKHGVKLGFMGFFVKACIQALKEIPAVNAEIDGEDIIYKNHYDIGVAVSTPQGLVVPVVRDADQMSLAEIEMAIGDLGKRARDGKLAVDEMMGGTFTITNGGVFGSMMSTPILNPPQSGILGMHKTYERAVAVNGEIKIRPMMYTALSYDHRIIDGREAVTFLVKVKEAIEDPQRLLLEV